MKNVNNIVVFLGCGLLFDANFEYSAFKMRFEPLINFLYNLILRKNGAFVSMETLGYG